MVVSHFPVTFVSISIIVIRFFLLGKFEAPSSSPGLRCGGPRLRFFLVN